MKNIILIAIVVCLTGCATDSALFSNSPCKEGYEYYFLNRAAANTDLYGAELLLKGGANVDGKGYVNYINCGGGMEYSSPLMVAVHVVVQEAAKGDPQRVDREAVLKAETNMVELLLKAGANPNIREGEGVTPLDIAKYYKNTSIIRLLEQYGAK